MSGRYCCYCAGLLVLPHFAVVQNPAGQAVRVHKKCRTIAQLDWSGDLRARLKQMRWESHFIRYVPACQ